MEIKRDYYLNKLIAKKHNGLIKVITGMRRCGKSYLLFTLFKKHLQEQGVAKDIITEFRGRGDELHMNPLSFAEFMSVYEGNKYDGWHEYVLYGGLPPVVLLPTPEQKIEFLKRLFDETYVNDIVGRQKIRNKDEFEELINILSSGIGSLTNPKKLADTFKTKKQIKISVNTFKSYLDYLCDAFIKQGKSKKASAAFLRLFTGCGF